ncbi:hypothetical protein E7Z59_07030 [Robertkochia marina]|uniref:Lipoprotein n=1 Tax=Robertkochia marina TaxID=1227945 RepID=A0A4S3LZS3_9FLAO|nr:hypothetical protein [Robertkochia marina]THD67408.1 hypothetical protein E7Z59_07030 [Robertkochia marina]TRZ43064.1 hypothetical protein D3A96_11345 [Robertkochia marina]
MKKVIFYIFIISVLCSCTSNTRKTFSEIEILNDVFLDLIGTQYYYEELPIPPLPLEYAENKQDSLRYKIQKEQFDEAYDNPKLDSSKLVIGILPSFINPKQAFEYWNPKQESFPRIHYSPELHSKEFDQLLTKMVDSTDFNPGKIELNALKNKGRYIIKDLAILASQDPEYWKSPDYRYIGSIRFSDFKINKNNDKAIFYYSMPCGRLCGSGELIFCVKSNGKWKIADTIQLWVS